MFEASPPCCPKIYRDAFFDLESKDGKAEPLIGAVEKGSPRLVGVAPLLT